MKYKYIFLIPIFVLFLSSCKKTLYTVTYNIDNQLYKTIEVKKGSLIDNLIVKKTK